MSRNSVAHASSPSSTSTPSARSAPVTAGSRSCSRSACTRSVSAALQTPGRCTLALTAIATAIAGSAEASRKTWLLPPAAASTGIRECSSRKCLSSSPPRGMTTSAAAGSAMNWASRSRLSGSACTASAGSPASVSPSRTTSSSAAFECTASREPRSRQALPDLTHRAAASTVTLGRASYTISTTPSGTRRFSTSSPLGSVMTAIGRSAGSGSAATARTAAARPRTRSGVSVSRSTIDGRSPCAAATSTALAARIASAPRSIACATASSARSFASASSGASARAARRASWLIVAVERDCHSSTRLSRCTASSMPLAPARRRSSSAG